MKIGISLPGSPWTAQLDGWDEHKAWIAKHCDQVGLPMPYWQQIAPTPTAWDMSQFFGIDRIVAEANALKLPVFMFPHSAPAWAIAKHSAAHKGKSNLTPDDLTPAGPWAAYLAFVIRRYAGKVAWLAPFNEPNFEFLADPDHYIADCVTMTKTAAIAAAGIPNAPMLLVPNLLDADVKGFSNWRYWLEHYLNGLRGWHPPTGVKLGCGWHPYGDIHDGVSTRTQGALDLLVKHPTALGRKLYLTEGGYQFDTHPDGTAQWHYDYSDPGEVVTQRDHLARFYSWCIGHAEPKIRGEIVLGQQWVLQDTGWGSWFSGLHSPDGTAHPIVPLWEAIRHR